MSPATRTASIASPATRSARCPSTASCSASRSAPWKVRPMCQSEVCRNLTVAKGRPGPDEKAKARRLLTRTCVLTRECRCGHALRGFDLFAGQLPRATDRARFLSVGSAMMSARSDPGGRLGGGEVATVLTTAAIVLAVLLLFAVAVLWRLYNDGMRRADAAARQVAAERAKSDQQQLALRRYEVAFASISGRGELGEQVLVETARALGLRENLHFTLQTDVGGGGSAKPDMVLRVGGDRTVPVDAKASMAIWAEAVETDDPAERIDALRAHVRQVRSRAAELAGKGYQRWAAAIYGTIMFIPSAAVAALDTDPELLRWLIDRRVCLCGPTGFGVLASAALFAASDRTLEADVEQVRAGAAAAHRAAGGAVEALNLSSTHLQRILSARRRELEALETFRATVAPLTDAAGSPAQLPQDRNGGGLAA